MRFYINVIPTYHTPEEWSTFQMIAKHYLKRHLPIKSQKLFIYTYPEYKLLHKLYLTVSIKMEPYRFDRIVDTGALVELLQQHHERYIEGRGAVSENLLKDEILSTIRRIKIFNAIKEENLTK